MNKKEVINQLKSLKEHCEGWKEEPWVDDVQALDYAIKKLEETTLEVPVQEQLEKLYLSNVSIKDLVDELLKRNDCVTELRAEPYEKYSISREYNGTITDLGPATILRIID
ncbi:BC1881 family protein [Clostridium hydrogeniformans]|uniref:BC1881 family protein n=1 Tax=Clostridium hydrogeniformans TaxID=349933 RepID=UPI0005526802|nr:BC1881 family protein [Clostridium hydrogeniformans]